MSQTTGTDDSLQRKLDLQLFDFLQSSLLLLQNRDVRRQLIIRRISRNAHASHFCYGFCVAGSLNYSSVFITRNRLLVGPSPLTCASIRRTLPCQTVRNCRLVVAGAKPSVRITPSDLNARVAGKLLRHDAIMIEDHRVQRHRFGHGRPGAQG